MTSVAVADPVDLRVRLDRLESLRALRVAEEQGRELWTAEPHQVAPDTGWSVWLLLAGRGAGKTDACASFFDRYMRRNAGTRGAIIAPTLGDAAEACVNGPSGLKFHNPSVTLSSGAGGTHVRWANGSEAKLFGTHTREDVERLRAGGNRQIVWCEELAAWRYLEEAWEQMEFGLRMSSRPLVIASTTPKPRPLIRKLRNAATTALATATTYDNPHLPSRVKDALREKYEGTRIGRQELMGELIEEVEGALWTMEMLEQSHVTDHPDLTRVGVAVDPSGGDQDGNDEQGIIVAGTGVDGLAYILADRSCKLSPGGWGARAVQAWEEFGADFIVVETNYGGAMAKSTIEAAAKAMGVAGVKVEVITASRGKQARAEPVAALYEQGRVKHVGVFEELELQQTQWTADSGWSPDRMDAAVWILTKLMLGATKRRLLPAGHAA